MVPPHGRSRRGTHSNVCSKQLSAIGVALSERSVDIDAAFAASSGRQDRQLEVDNLRSENVKSGGAAAESLGEAERIGTRVIGFLHEVTEIVAVVFAAVFTVDL